jgi:uncharacterized protein
MNSKLNKAKRFLFFFIHPAYFHVFRNTINSLKEKGHHVDIVITSKDVLQELVKNEGWKYTNIFPKGRKISWLPIYLGAAINFFRTLLKLEIYLINKKYDLFITDDLLGFNGIAHRTPNILFQDDDVTAVPETVIAHRFTKHIFSQFCSNMGKFEHKKIPFDGYKELGYLHPNRFIPNFDIVRRFNPEGGKYFILRLVSLRATHDVGISGLTNEDVRQIISKLEKHGKVFITAERELPEEFEEYRIKIKVNEIAQALNFAELVISDSQTMSAESGVLGTPYIRYNDFVGRISYLEELEQKYKLGYGIKTKDKELLFVKLDEMLLNPNLKDTWKEKRRLMLEDKVDLTEYMIWLFENYPNSAKIIENNPGFQYKFK